jgi:hypothetical protein
MFTEQQEAFLRRMDGDIHLHATADSDGERLLQILCEQIGPRPAGGSGMRQARELLSGRLAEIGAVNIHTEPVPVRTWQPGEPSIELLQPYRQAFPCAQYLYSAPIHASLPLVDLGSAAPDEITRRAGEFAEKAVLMDGHTAAGSKYLSVRQRIDCACRAGAQAIVMRSTPPTGLPALDIACLNDELPIPCFSVSGESGRSLSAATETGTATVYLRATGSTSPGMCANLVADLGPDDLPEEIIILGAHLDSYWNAPGAGDDLTGIVTMLELARLLAPYRQAFQRTLRLVAFTAEEIGNLGSRAYVADNPEAIARTRFMLNMDVLFTATAHGMAIMWSPEMRDYCEQAFRDAGRRVDVRNLFCTSSDYFPFMLAGVPAARPADWEGSFPIWWHSAADDLAHIRPEWVLQNALTYAPLLGRLLTDPQPLPCRRLSPADVQSRLAQEDLGEWLQAQGYGV